MAEREEILHESATVRFVLTTRKMGFRPGIRSAVTLWHVANGMMSSKFGDDDSKTIATKTDFPATQKNIDLLHRSSREPAMEWVNAKLAQLAAQSAQEQA